VKHPHREREQGITWLLMMNERSARINNIFMRKVEGIDMEKVIDAFLRYFVANAPKKDAVQLIPQQVAVL
jgi:hypothetical protein